MASLGPQSASTSHISDEVSLLIEPPTKYTVNGANIPDHNIYK